MDDTTTDSRFPARLAIAFFATFVAFCALTPSAFSLDEPKASRTARPVFPSTAYITRDRPRRTPGTLRYANLSDIEMRQIMRIAEKENPGAILNVSGVTVGCPCEDGANCEDQVWIVAYKKKRTRGMMLSNIDGQWEIGPVQKWWLRRDRLDAEYRDLFDIDRKGWRESQLQYYEALTRLIEEFPKCDAAPAIEE